MTAVPPVPDGTASPADPVIADGGSVVSGSVLTGTTGATTPDAPGAGPAVPASPFARPPTVRGSFDPHRRQGGPAPLLRPPVPAMFADAFARPAGYRDSLQRDPHPAPVLPVDDTPADPWRNPDAPVALGGPALPTEVAPEKEPEPARPYSLREALFERRLRPGALLGLGAGAAIIGVVGAVIGGFVVSRMPTPAINPDFRVSAVAPAVTRDPGTVAEVAARVTPAVVSLEIQVGDGGESGSGVVFDGAGYILTNNHVISTAAANPTATLTVVFSDGTRVPGEIVGRDPRTDLAVVKVTVDGLTVAPLGASSELAVGDTVIAIGSPLGLAGTVTTGIVSAVDRPVRLGGDGTDTEAVIDAIQTDAAINPGNSGGALVDDQGAIIGINTAIRTLSSESGSIGLGFAIPIDMAKEIAEEIIRTGSAVHADIGIDARSATDGITDGAQVQNVRSGSPAEAAGIREEDVIIRVGDRQVRDADELVVAVQSQVIGEPVEVELLRAGRSMTVTVTPVAD